MTNVSLCCRPPPLLAWVLSSEFAYRVLMRCVRHAISSDPFVKRRVQDELFATDVVKYWISAQEDAERWKKRMLEGTGVGGKGSWCSSPGGQQRNNRRGRGGPRGGSHSQQQISGGPVFAGGGGPGALLGTLGEESEFIPEDPGMTATNVQLTEHPESTFWDLDWSLQTRAREDALRKRVWYRDFLRDRQATIMPLAEAARLGLLHSWNAFLGGRSRQDPTVLHSAKFERDLGRVFGRAVRVTNEKAFKNPTVVFSPDGQPLSFLPGSFHGLQQILWDAERLVNRKKALRLQDKRFLRKLGRMRDDGMIKEALLIDGSGRRAGGSDVSSDAASSQFEDGSSDASSIVSVDSEDARSSVGSISSSKRSRFGNVQAITAGQMQRKMLGMDDSHVFALPGDEDAAEEVLWTGTEAGNLIFHGGLFALQVGIGF